MLKAFLGAFGILFICSITAAAQKPSSATYVMSADIQDLVKKLPPTFTENAVRTVDSGATNIGIAVVHRPQAANGKSGGPFEHDKVSEVYYVLAGTATLATGGTLVNEKQGSGADPLVGPGKNGTASEGSESRRIGPGDAVIIPAGVAHWWVEIQQPITYMIIRVDPGKITPLK